MLFSEPKIPQSIFTVALETAVQGFSALQRAENSSIQSARRADGSTAVSVLFSEPKIPQYLANAATIVAKQRFSALQRAENSSILHRQPRQQFDDVFQCSSASRKFLNPARPLDRRCAGWVSVLFSEPKIPQSRVGCTPRRAQRVSVLFSEPKIPQSPPTTYCTQARRRFQCSSASRKFLNKSACCDGCCCTLGFSALQRAENSSIDPHEIVAPPPPRFQCSSASRKFLNRACPSAGTTSAGVSVLFSEPKIPQFFDAQQRNNRVACFSALQRAENSSIEPRFCAISRILEFQCSSASRKFLNSIRLSPRAGRM